MQNAGVSRFVAFVLTSTNICVINTLLSSHLPVHEYELSTYTKGKNHEMKKGLCLSFTAESKRDSIQPNPPTGANYKWA